MANYIPLWITPNFPPKSCRAIHGTVRLPGIPSFCVTQGSTTLVLLKGESGGQWGLNGQRWCWKLGWSQTNPNFACWVVLLSFDLSTDLRFWTWRIHVLMVRVCMHTVRWVKCQKDWCSGIAVLRSYRFPDDCIRLKIRSLAFVNAVWGSKAGCVCSCSPAGAFNQPGDCLHLELYSGFLSLILFSWNSTRHSTSPSLAYTWELSWNGVFFYTFSIFFLQ